MESLNEEALLAKLLGGKKWDPTKAHANTNRSIKPTMKKTAGGSSERPLIVESPAKSSAIVVAACQAPVQHAFPNAEATPLSQGVGSGSSANLEVPPAMLASTSQKMVELKHAKKIKIVNAGSSQVQVDASAASARVPVEASLSLAEKIVPSIVETPTNVPRQRNTTFVDPDLFQEKAEGEHAGQHRLSPMDSLENTNLQKDVVRVDSLADDDGFLQFGAKESEEDGEKEEGEVKEDEEAAGKADLPSDTRAGKAAEIVVMAAAGMASEQLSEVANKSSEPASDERKEKKKKRKRKRGAGPGGASSSVLVRGGSAMKAAVSGEADAHAIAVLRLQEELEAVKMEFWTSRAHIIRLEREMEMLKKTAVCAVEGGDPPALRIGATPISQNPALPDDPFWKYAKKVREDASGVQALGAKLNKSLVNAHSALIEMLDGIAFIGVERAPSKEA